MPLDVTTGSATAAVGGEPPGFASPSDSGPPGGLAVLFAALLAQQGQTTPATPPKAKTALMTDATETDGPKHDKPSKTDAPQSLAQEPKDPTAINWTAIAALQIPVPALAQKTLPTADTTVSSTPTKKEVMDTASLSAPVAPAAQTDIPSSGLLPLPIAPPTQLAPPTQSTATDSARVVTGTAAGPSGQMTAPPAREVITATDAYIVPSANVVAAVAAIPMAMARPSQSAVPVPLAAATVSDVAAFPAPALPSPPVFPAANGIPLSSSPATIPTLLPILMPGMKSKSAAAGTEFKKPFMSRMARPAVLPSNTAVLDPKKGSPAQIALQSRAVPANNTGIAEALSDIRPATTAETPSAPAKIETPPASPVTASIAGVAAKPVPSTDHEVDSGQPLPQAAALTTADKSASGDKSLKEGEASADTGQDSTIPPTAPIAVTAQNPVGLGGTAPVAPEKPLTGAERAQVVRQTADAINTVKPQTAAAGQGQMTLHLHPKEWGDLRVTVQLTPSPALEGAKQTAVVAHVVASSPVVKAALEKHSSDLNQALHETGLRLERLTVTVQAVGAGEQSGGAAGEGQSFTQKGQDQWQGTQSQTSAGSGGWGAGHSSSFASSSERQGGGFHNHSASRSPYTSGDEGDTDISPVQGQTPKSSAGFDQRV